MKTFLRTALLVATLASVAFMAEAVHAGTASAAPGPMCFRNSVTGALTCVDQFGNPIPPFPVPAQPQLQLFPGCMTTASGVLLCPAGTRLLIQPQPLFLVRLLLVRQPVFQPFMFQRCFMTTFGTLVCF